MGECGIKAKLEAILDIIDHDIRSTHIKIRPMTLRNNVDTVGSGTVTRNRDHPRPLKHMALVVHIQPSKTKAANTTVASELQSDMISENDAVDVSSGYGSSVPYYGCVIGSPYT